MYTDTTARSHFPPVDHGSIAAPGFRLAAANDESGDSGGDKRRERDRRRQTMRAAATAAK